MHYAPLLINMHMHGVVKEVNIGEMERGAALIRSRENRDWVENQLLFVDDNILVPDSEEELSRPFREFERIC